MNNEPNIIIPNVGDKEVFDNFEYVYTEEDINSLKAEQGLWTWLRHNGFNPLEMTITTFTPDSVTINFRKIGG